MGANTPTYVGTGTGAVGTGDVVPGLPASLQNDDILILAVESYGAEAAPATPSGWTLHSSVISSTDGTDATRNTVFWLRVAGGETAPTVTDTGNHTAAKILAFRGCKTTGSPFNATGSNVSATQQTSHTLGAVTTTSDECLIVYVVTWGVSRDSQSWSNSALREPSITMIGNVKTGSGNDGTIALGYGGRNIAGSTGAGSVASSPSSTESAVQTLALEPAEISKPYYVALGSFQNGTGGVTPGLPTGWAVDDIHILQVETHAPDTVSTPSGWTLLVSVTTGGTSADKTRNTIFWRRAESGDTAPTITDPGDHVSAWISGWRKCKTTGSPINVHATSVSTTNTTSMSCPAVTTTVDDCLILHTFTVGDNVTASVNDWANANLASPAITGTYTAWHNSGNDGTMCMSRGGLPTAGDSGTATCTITNPEERASITLALEPAATTGPTYDETGKTHALTATAAVDDTLDADDTGKSHALSNTAAAADTSVMDETGKSHALTATAEVTDVYTAAGLLEIDWDNLADEADIGNTGGQGDPWEFGFTNGTTTVKANANSIDYGTDPSLTNTMRVSVVSGAAAARGWDASIGTATDIAFLVPVILTSLPGATEEVEPIRFRTNTNAVNAVVQIEGNGDVQIRRLAGTLVDSTGAGAVSAGDTIWLQGLFNFDNSGSLELKIYDDTGTLIDTLSGTGIDTFNGAATDNVQIGAGTTDAVGNFTIEFGRVKLETGASAHIAMPSFPTVYDETGKTHALTATATSSDSASFADSAAHALTATAEVADTSAMADSVSHALSATAVVTDVFSGTFIETGKTHALTATAQVTDVLASSMVSQTFQMLWSVEGATLPTTPDLDTLTPPAVQGPTHVPKATPR